MQDATANIDKKYNLFLLTFIDSLSNLQYDDCTNKKVAGIRCCGKSYLLFELYTRYLLGSGVGEDQIVGLALDELPNAKYRNPIELDKYIRSRITDKTKRYYVLIDEIQFVSEIQNPYVDDPDAKLTFIDVVLSG